MSGEIEADPYARALHHVSAPHARKKEAMTIREAVLAGVPGAYAKLSDRIRALGGRYKDVCDRVRHIHRTAGKPEPSDAEIDGHLQEDEAEGF